MEANLNLIFIRSEVCLVFWTDDAIRQFVRIEAVSDVVVQVLQEYYENCHLSLKALSQQVSFPLIHRLEHHLLTIADFLAICLVSDWQMHAHEHHAPCQILIGFAGASFILIKHFCQTDTVLTTLAH